MSLMEKLDQDKMIKCRYTDQSGDNANQLSNLIYRIFSNIADWQEEIEGKLNEIVESINEQKEHTK